MPDRGHLLRVSGHYVEVAAVALLGAACIALDVPSNKTQLHIMFAVSTMSLVHCVGCCRTIGERTDDLTAVSTALFRGGRHETANYYQLLAVKAKGEGKLYYFVTAISLVAWVVGAIFFAKSISKQYISVAVPTCTAILIVLSFWKVWVTEKAFPHLDIDELAKAFSGSVHAQTAQPALAEQTAAVTRPR